MALWDELTSMSSSEHHRPPILITLDGIDHFMRMSFYRDASFKFIHAHDLALVNHFLAYLSGSKVFPNRGAVLAATCVSNKPAASTFANILRQRETNTGTSTSTSTTTTKATSRHHHHLTQPSPYARTDSRVSEVMNNIEDVQVLKGLNKSETRGILEYYAASGLFRGLVDDRTVAEKWSLAGGGVIGELERIGISPLL